MRISAASDSRGSAVDQVIRFPKRPDDHAGCAGYEILPPPEPEPLNGEQTADWVVPGSRLSGLAAARRLATLLPQARVVLLDAQRIGFGSSGATATASDNVTLWTMPIKS